MSTRPRARPWWGPRRPPAPAPKVEPETIEWLPLSDQPAIIWPEPGPEFIPPWSPPNYAEWMEALTTKVLRDYIAETGLSPFSFKKGDR